MYFEFDWAHRTKFSGPPGGGAGAAAHQVLDVHVYCGGDWNGDQ